MDIVAVISLSTPTRVLQCGVLMSAAMNNSIFWHIELLTFIPDDTTLQMAKRS
jgi:hypothetical protein